MPHTNTHNGGNMKLPTTEDIALMINYTIYDGEWEWHIRDIEENGTEEQKQEDIPLLKELQEKYGNEPPKEYVSTFAEDTEETRNLNTIAGKEDEYEEVLEAIEQGLALAVSGDESINDYGLIESMKLLKRNIEFKEQALDRTSIFVKSALLLAALESGLTRHETALCIQYFIKMIKEERKEHGKSNFANHLREQADEEIEEDDDDEYEDFFDKNIEEKYKCLMQENIHSAWAEEAFNDTIKELITEKQFAKAELLAKKGIELFDTMQSHYDFAMACWACSKLEEAKSHIQKALKLAKEEKPDGDIVNNIKIACQKVQNNEPFHLHKVSKEELLVLMQEVPKGAFVSPETLAAIAGSTVREIEFIANELVKEGKIEEANDCVMYRRKTNA